MGVRVASLLSHAPHQIFFDDTVLFGDASILEAKIWKATSKDYTNFVGKHIN
jgi:hypothetical protein